MPGEVVEYKPTILALAKILTDRGVLDITLDMPENFEWLPADMELAILRVVQECLTNVHRHAGTKTATIRLQRSDDAVHIEVRKGYIA